MATFSKAIYVYCDILSEKFAILIQHPKSFTFLNIKYIRRKKLQKKTQKGDIKIGKAVIKNKINLLIHLVH